eukprot:TRINITY_DN3211_c0_g1_i17.p1 TRINITY_DN3211_c0_g1~~TRINITY_DN3211_c0_g1_i17.p1  ORF type:complete len:637 (+),score=207.33 TRINITY_DN3211_c0_g1_i17:128-2038(+)
MSLTVQQLIADAKKLSTRLMDRDQGADQLISRGQDVLKEVEAMRQYQENIENLNEIAHQRPRAHLVLGIQQENRHIRSLQQENKELRATLEEHQAALELIMSKYREHISRMIKSTGKIEYNPDNLAKQLHEKTMKVYEMAAVMKEAVRRDEEKDGHERELIARLYTENKGLRELLEISQKSRSVTAEKKTPVTRTEVSVQTEDFLRDKVDVEVTLPMPTPPRRHNRVHANAAGGQGHQQQQAEKSPLGAGGTAVGKLGDSNKKVEETSDSEGVAPISPDDFTSSSSSSSSDTASLSASEEEETSDDDSVKYDTIKLRRKNPPTTSDTSNPTTLPPKDKSADSASVAGGKDLLTESGPLADDSVSCAGPQEDHVVDGSAQIKSDKPAAGEPQSAAATAATNSSLEDHLNTLNNNNTPSTGDGASLAPLSHPPSHPTIPPAAVPEQSKSESSTKEGPPSPTAAPKNEEVTSTKKEVEKSAEVDRSSIAEDTAEVIIANDIVIEEEAEINENVDVDCYASEVAGNSSDAPKSGNDDKAETGNTGDASKVAAKGSSDASGAGNKTSDASGVGNKTSDASVAGNKTGVGNKTSDASRVANDTSVASEVGNNTSNAPNVAVTNCESIINDLITESVANSATR